MLYKLGCALPLDLVFDRLLNQADAFKHISDVIDPSFLDGQFIRGVIKIDFFAPRVLDEVDKLLRELSEAIVYPSPRQRNIFFLHHRTPRLIIE